MRHSIIVAVGLAFASAAATEAQSLSSGMIGAYRAGHPGFAAAGVTPKQASLWTATLPTTFSRLERVDGNWQLGANMAVGGSYVFVTGKATPQVDGSYRLDPQFMIGPVANIGITPGSNGKLDGTLLVGGTIGFSTFAILGGYDLLLSRPVIGVGVQMQSLTFTESLTKLTSLR